MCSSLNVYGLQLSFVNSSELFSLQLELSQALKEIRVTVTLPCVCCNLCWYGLRSSLQPDTMCFWSQHGSFFGKHWHLDMLKTLHVALHLYRTPKQSLVWACRFACGQACLLLFHLQIALLRPIHVVLACMFANIINTKIFAIQKKFLRGINFVKITKNIFQSTRLPEERMGVTEKIGGRNESP